MLETARERERERRYKKMKETGKEIKSLRDEWIQRDVERDKVKNI
jgi:hypothetical protein